jgi:hypothetical protein
MYILDKISDKSLSNAIIYLTHLEALELRDSIEELLKQPSNNHAHICNEESPKSLESYGARAP